MDSGLILGIDSATAFASVGLVRDGHILVERTEHCSGKHASRLPALVESALEEAGAAPSALGAIAVSIGPGSFTGLRVGIGFGKGIAYASGVPMIGVSTLDGLAAAADERGRVAVCLDARKGEVYLALYLPGEHVHARVGLDRALSPEEAASEIERHFEVHGGVVVGDAAERYAEAFSRFDCRPFGDVHPRGGWIAALGSRRLAEGAGERPEDLAPAYVRASTAELRARAQLR